MVLLLPLSGSVSAPLDLAFDVDELVLKLTHLGTNAAGRFGLLELLPELVELKFELGDLAADALRTLIFKLVDLLLDLLLLRLIFLLLEGCLPGLGSCWIAMSVNRAQGSEMR